MWLTLFCFRFSCCWRSEGGREGAAPLSQRGTPHTSRCQPAAADHSHTLSKQGDCSFTHSSHCPYPPAVLFLLFLPPPPLLHRRRCRCSYLLLFFFSAALRANSDTRATTNSAQQQSGNWQPTSAAPSLSTTLPVSPLLPLRCCASPLLFFPPPLSAAVPLLLCHSSSHQSSCSAISPSLYSHLRRTRRCFLFASLFAFVLSSRTTPPLRRCTVESAVAALSSPLQLHDRLHDSI